MYISGQNPSLVIHQADSPNSTNVFPHQTGVLTSINLDFPKEGSSYEIGKKLRTYVFQ